MSQGTLRNLNPRIQGLKSSTLVGRCESSAPGKWFFKQSVLVMLARKVITSHPHFHIKANFTPTMTSNRPAYSESGSPVPALPIKFIIRFSKPRLPFNFLCHLWTMADSLGALLLCSTLDRNLTRRVVHHPMRWMERESFANSWKIIITGLLF